MNGRMIGKKNKKTEETVKDRGRKEGKY